jgi:hypothetical protein
LIFISSCYVQFPLAAVKISVLLFYKRVFPTPMFRTVVWFVIGIVSIWAVLFFLLVLLELDPVAFPLMTAGLRMDSSAIGLGQVASSFALDVLVLCLPLPVIFRLHMKWERKLAVALIFWLGAFCAVAAIVRTVLLDQSIREVVASVSYTKVGKHHLPQTRHYPSTRAVLTEKPPIYSKPIQTVHLHGARAQLLHPGGVPADLWPPGLGWPRARVPRAQRPQRLQSPQRQEQQLGGELAEEPQQERGRVAGRAPRRRNRGLVPQGLPGDAESFAAGAQSTRRGATEGRPLKENRACVSSLYCGTAKFLRCMWGLLSLRKRYSWPINILYWI